MKDETFSKRRVKELVKKGFTIKEDNSIYALLTTSTGGHFGIHVLLLVLTVWWTFGIANLIYMILATKEVKLWKEGKYDRIKESDRVEDDCSEDMSEEEAQ